MILFCTKRANPIFYCPKRAFLLYLCICLTKGGEKMKLSRQEVEHVALLARLELTEEEISKYTEQLNSVLEYRNAAKA
jgi:hypothetical protein